MAAIYVCEDGAQGTAGELNGSERPTCGDGQWENVRSVISEAHQFTVADLDPAIIASAFGAGIVLTATAIMIGTGVRQILRMVGS